MAVFENSQPIDLLPMELPLMSSAAGSRAKTFPGLASGLALKVNGLVSGSNTGEFLASFDRATSSWRTCQACFLSEWAPFSGTWPRSGTMQSGTAYQLVPLVPLTKGIASGLLPTPTRTDHKSESMSFALTERRQAESKRGVRLTEFLHRQNLPTPMRGNSHWGARLDEWAGSTNPFRGTEIGQLPLNPCWIEELMGFPIGWTDVAPSATPSFQKLQPSSEKPSSPQPA